MLCLIDSVTPGTLVGKDTVRTVLILQRARKQDSGNYTCAVADIAEATVTVHILNGESERVLICNSKLSPQGLTGQCARSASV